MSSGRVSFRDTSKSPKNSLTWKSLSDNGLRLASRAACPVPSIVAEEQRGTNQTESKMKKDRKEIVSSEPLGIIISRGDKTEPTPIFSAYIWGPVPDAVEDSATRAA